MGLFKDIAGNAARLAELERDIRAGNLAHAYLFSGPANIGKFTVAKKMAQALQCTATPRVSSSTPGGGAEPASTPGEACGECTSCSEMERGIHSDTIEAGDNGESIKIKEIREVIDKVNMSRQSNYKLVLIENIERMGTEAANALLKTLEDPPAGVIFLLTTAHLKEILPTIISRVRHLKFNELNKEELTGFIRNVFPLEESEIVEAAVDFAQGKAGKALDFMRNPKAMEALKESGEKLKQFLHKPDLVEQFAYVNDLIKAAKDEEDKSQIVNFLESFMAILRGEMNAAVRGAGNPILVRRAARAVKEAQKARALLKNNINTKLLLENLMLSLAE